MDLNCVDNNKIEQLSESIESIATSGQNEIDGNKLKVIKKICRISDVYVNECFKLLMHQLSQKHSEIRLSSFNIVKELFQRSHHFRELISNDFQIFSKTVLDIDPEDPLPPPAAAAKQLRLNAAKAIKEWNQVYGVAYKKLSVGFNYLKKCKIVDFDDMEARTTQQRNQIEEREARLSSFKQTQLHSLLEEYSTEETDIIECITQVQNGLSLLVPDDCEETATTSLDESLVSRDDLRAHGLTDPNFSLIVEIKPIRVAVNRDNKEVIQCLKDQFKLLNGRFLPLVRTWNISAAKLGAEESFQKKTIDLKMKLEAIVQKYHELNLPQLGDDEGSDSEPDFDLETVPDQDCLNEDETLIPLIKPRLSYMEEFIMNDNEPSTSSAQIDQQKKSSKSSLNETKLPIDIDSYEVSQSKLPANKISFSLNSVESYWVQDAETSPTDTAALLMNPVELTEAFRPVEWECRAPLPSGRLCPRKDRQKCPLHGKIVARDEIGQPIDPSSVPKPKKPSVPDWQEPGLLRDIKAATGVDLTMPVKGKRLKKNQHPNLTDIRAKANTPRSRLEKKVFKK